MVVEGLRDAIIFGWRFGSRCTRYGLVGWRFGSRCTRCGLDFVQSFRLRLGLSNKYRLRCHVGRRWRRGGESLYRVGMPSLWKTDAVAGDYHRRTALQRCIRNEQQCNQCKTYHTKKGENWHCLLHSLYEGAIDERQNLT